MRAIAALCLFASGCLAQTADVVFLVDESVGMGREHDWIQTHAVKLDTALISYGLNANRYALVGFARADPYPHTIPVGTTDFGPAFQLALAADSLVTTGTTEDGYAAVAHALTSLAFRPDAEPVLVLMTDEDRDALTAATYESTLASITGAGATLHVVIDATLQTGAGAPAIGLDHAHITLLADGAGGFEPGPPRLVAAAFGTSAIDYAQLAFQAGGSVWDTTTLRATNTDADSFTSALAWVVARAANPPVCIPDVTTLNAAPGDPLYGVPDGLVTAIDLNYYVNLWVAADPAADLTTRNAAEGDPLFGTPDGVVSAIDLQYFVNAWLAGCP